jgi:hypothetical protein
LGIALARGLTKGIILVSLNEMDSGTVGPHSDSDVLERLAKMIPLVDP